MPIPPDARQVPGEPNRVRLSDGRTVTRATALTEGARYMGYKSHFEYRKSAKGDANYVKAFLSSRQGEAALAKEKALAKAENRRFNMGQFNTRIIAARNSAHKPRGSSREAWLDFMDRYDLADAEEFVDY